MMMMGQKDQLLTSTVYMSVSPGSWEIRAGESRPNPCSDLHRSSPGDGAGQLRNMDLGLVWSHMCMFAF